MTAAGKILSLIVDESENVILFVCLSSSTTVCLNIFTKYDEQLRKEKETIHFTILCDHAHLRSTKSILETSMYIAVDIA